MISILISCVLLLSPAERDSILAEMPSNAGFWEQTFSRYSADTLTYCESLFLTISPEDRESITTAILEDHLLNALNSRYSFYNDLPDSIFMHYLLPYRINNEPLSSYRSVLEAWISRRVQPAETPVEMAEAIRDVITHTIDLTESASDDPVLTPTQIIPSGQASTEARWILLGASLRTFGIPARPVRGWFPGVDRNLYLWFDIWTGDGWQNLSNGTPPLEYLKAAIEHPSMTNITADYRNTGTLLTTPLVDYIEDSWSVKLLLPSGDDFTVIDNLHIDPYERVSTELGTGEYVLRVQFSSTNQVIGEWLRTIKISADSMIVIDLTEAEYAMTPLP